MGDMGSCVTERRKIVRSEPLPSPSLRPILTYSQAGLSSPNHD
jgi:hypothetical protein